MSKYPSKSGVSIVRTWACDPSSWSGECDLFVFDNHSVWFCIWWWWCPLLVDCRLAFNLVIGNGIEIMMDIYVLCAWLGAARGEWWSYRCMEMCSGLIRLYPIDWFMFLCIPEWLFPNTYSIWDQSVHPLTFSKHVGCMKERWSASSNTKLVLL